MVLLLVAGALRVIFLGRNFTSRLSATKGIPFVIMLGVELVYFNMVMSSFFQNSASAAPVAPAIVVASANKAAHFRIF